MTVCGLDFVVIDRRDIPPLRHNCKGRPSRYVATLREFMLSGADAIEVPDAHWQSGVRCLNKRIREAHMEHLVEAISREKRVFLRRVKP